MVSDIVSLFFNLFKDTLIFTDIYYLLCVTCVICVISCLFSYLLRGKY